MTVVAPDKRDAASAAASEGVGRRALLVATGAAALGIAAYPILRRRQFAPTSVFVARHQRYDGPLAQTIADGLNSVGLREADLRGCRVLLKPNLVEPVHTSPHMTTNPAVVLAAADVLRRWGASVTVGEGPGHLRDTELVLAESAMGPALTSAKLPFIDLNYDEVKAIPNASQVSPLTEICLPRAVLEADFVISMPKLKTHHWVGITASMKNLYGVMPGCVYGWPKNVLHHAGIPQTVVDINASLPRTLAIVDAIECMEGDGPIMGTAKHMGLIAVGQNVASLDATLARIMGLLPERVSYLAIADGRIGPLLDGQIEQRGEAWRNVASPFNILDRPELQQLRASEADIRTS
ncbi:MAG: DUF362 domain-containing protein [Pirellulales bacterium]